MAEQLSPPREFLDWLEKAYSEREATIWKARNAIGVSGSLWPKDTIYLYWEKYITPTQRQPELNLQQQMKNALQGATAEESEELVQEWIDRGLFKSQEEINDLVAWWGKQPEPISPLAKREMESKLSQALSSVTDNPFVPDEEKALITGAEGQKLQKAYLNGESEEIFDVITQMLSRAQAQEAGPAARARATLATMAELGKPRPKKEEWQPPPMPEVEPIAKEFLEETGLGKSTRLMSYLAGEYIPEIIEETQAARQAWWEKMNLPPSREEDGASAITQLQEAARQAANTAWGGLSEAEMESGKPPRSEEVIGGTYFGEGGLRGQAEQAYRHIIGLLEEKVPAQERLAKGLEYVGGEEAYAKKYGEPTLAEKRALVQAAGEAGYGMPKPPEPEEDPLVAALRRKNFMAGFYKAPGTGLVSRLTPAVRY